MVGAYDGRGGFERGCGRVVGCASRLLVFGGEGRVVDGVEGLGLEYASTVLALPPL